ncbi:hypothetical protein C1T17_07920 [Sphingobium sp. SCG-1]|uniref:hypothetical protein n=1 Tax=Sphingobium sp. SCG-1 TaxID=2072936 RepID=UPI000CD6BC79|nr:hypothetical protein [Sphingobium sp. SCG-1]AUW58044.1 hypothetical protein C1T17_07920 [Sphingobium sp. SCG-1]
MRPTIDPASDTGPRFRAERVPRSASFSDLPDLSERPRRRLHPMVFAGGVFLMASAAFYGAEALLPPSFKPSVFTGGYQREIAKAKSEGELASRIQYDKQLKVYETAAVVWQEQCKASLQALNSNYEAVYRRAGVGYQLAADLQKQYANYRYAIAQSSVGGEIGVANTATTFGYWIGLLDPEMGKQSLEFAENARRQAYAKLDEAAQSGITVSAEGWDDGLVDPASFSGKFRCDMPSAPLALQPSSEG